MVSAMLGVHEVEKRDGRIVAFDRTKIVAAIMKAAQSVQGSDYRLAEELADQVVAVLAGGGEREAGVPTVERVQDVIEKVLIEHGHARTAKAFIIYRARRNRIREGKSELMDAVGDILAPREEQDPGRTSASKHQAIGVSACQEYYRRRVIPEALADAHDRGDWFLHGLSHYDQTPHSALIPLRSHLEQGFDSGHGFVRPARRTGSLAALTSVILAAYQAEVHGGTAVPHFDAAWGHAAPPGSTAEALAEAAEALLFNLNTVASSAPRVSLHVGLDTGHQARLVTGALLQALESGVGRGDVTVRPHVVYVLRERVNLRPEDPNFDLTLQALRVSAHTPAITFLHDEPGSLLLGHAARLHRARLDFEGVGLLARLSVNLPRLALRSRREGFETGEHLGRILELAVEQLSHRHHALLRRPGREFPFLSGRCRPGHPMGDRTDSLAQALGTPTVTLNLVGLSEMLTVLSGQSHGISPSAQAEGLTLVRRLAQRGVELGEQRGLQVLVQAMAAPAASARFARLDRREFGIIRGVTDRSAYTLGAQVAPEIPLEAPERSSLEGAYAPLLIGGCLSSSEPSPGRTEDAGLSWLHRGIGSGLRILAEVFPIATCRDCGTLSREAAQEPCGHCGAPAARLVPVALPHGDLEGEA